MNYRERLPRNWGKYRLISIIGSGGMGKIYRAYDPNLSRYVAIKVLRVEDPVIARRFLREARAQAKVNHKNICKVYEAGELRGKPYIVMQLIEGKTLEEIKDEMPLEARVHVIKDVAEALHKAHTLGLIHRDIKPSNIMVERTEEGEWKPYIVDFGLVKEKEVPSSTITRTILGTPYYMSPEQARGRNKILDRRTDVYSLGATLYFILTGKPPFDGPMIDVIRKVVEEEPIPIRKLNPSVPKDLETIVMKCLEKDPQLRYSSAKALAEELKRFLNGEPIEAKRKSLFYTIRKKILKYKTIAIIITFSIVASGIFMGMAIKEKARQKTITRFAREYDEEIKYTENLLWYAYTKPIHDIRTEKTLIEDRLKLLEKLILERDSAGYGPGFYALGRGYMNLEKYHTAKKYLELAWNKYGYRGSEIRYAIGLTLTKLYLRELLRANRISDRNLRERIKKKLKKKYLRVALSHIKILGSKSPYPREYAMGVISFLKKNYISALKHMERASKKFPWLYDAQKFQGDIYTSIGDDEKNKGRIEEALNLYKKAEEIYKKLIEESESYPAAYIGLCQLYEKIGDLLFFYFGEIPTNQLESAQKTCNKAIMIDPSDPEAYLNLSQIFLNRANYLLLGGKSPHDALKKSITFAKRALEINPDNFIAYIRIADAYLIMGAHERARGIDPMNSLSRAITYYRIALRLNPSDAKTLESMATAYWNMGSFFIRTGKDPTHAYDQGIKCLKKILEIHGDLHSIYNQLGNIYIDRCFYESKIGVNPFPSIEKAIRYYGKALNLMPGHSLINSNMGYAYLVKAKFLKERGRVNSAIEALNKSKSFLLKAKEVNPGLVWPFLYLADTEYLMAEINMDANKSPILHLKRAEQYLKKSLGISGKSKYIDIYLSMLNVYKLKALWSKKQGKDFTRYAKRGKILSEKVLQTHPGLKEAIRLKEDFIKLMSKNTTEKH